MLIQGVVRNAKGRIDQIHAKIRAELVNNFDTVGLIRALVEPHMPHHGSLPRYMRLPRSGVRSVSLKYTTSRGDHETILLYSAYMVGVNPLTINVPVAGDLTLTIDDVPAEHKAPVLVHAIALDELERKCRILKSAIDSLNNHYTTLGQACYIWPPFRSLIRPGGNAYKVTPEDVPETTRMSKAQSVAIPRETREQWTTIYNDLIMREMVCTK